MNVEILQDKILVVENAFGPDDYARISREIEQLRPRISPTYHETDVVLYRAVLDEIYSDRKSSFILQAIPTLLYSDEVVALAAEVDDLSYTLFGKQHKYTTVLTEMRGDTDYRSHTDTGSDINWTQIFLSWIWYCNPEPEKFSGGELVVENLDLSLSPKDNRLVLLPAYMNHRINPAVYSGEGYYRTTLNGFLTWSESAEGSRAGGGDGDLEFRLADAGRGATAAMVLPAPQGQLEQVRAVTASAIARLEAAGLDVGTAPSLLRRGDGKFQDGQFRDAFRQYRKAYQKAVGIEPV